MRLSSIASAAILIAFATTPLFAASSDINQLNQTPLSVYNESGSGIAISFSPSPESFSDLADRLRDSALPGEDNWTHGWVILPPTGGAEVKAENVEFAHLDGNPTDVQTISQEMMQPLVRLGSPVVFRGVRMASLSVATSVEDGADRLIVRRADVQVTFTPGKGVAEVLRPPMKMSAMWHSFVESSVLNPLSPNLPRRDLAPSNSGKLLILRPSALEDMDAVLELGRYAEWKRRTGLEVTTEIVDIENTSPQQIRHIIAEGYPDDPYDFVLLIGWDRIFNDEALMVPMENSAALRFPSFQLDGEQPDSGDYLYGTLDDLDGLNDWMPDVMVGRMMVQDAAKLRGALNRSILYEQDPYPGAEGHEGEWFNQAAVISDQTAADSGSVSFSDKEMGAWAMNGLRRLGINVDTLYVNQEQSREPERAFLTTSGVSVAIVEGYMLGAAYWDDGDAFVDDHGMNPLISANSLYYGLPTCYPYFSSAVFPHRNGPIGWISSAGYHYNPWDRNVNGGVVRALAQRHDNLIGNLYLSAIMETLTLEPFYSADVFHSFMRQFTLAGDPSVLIYTANPVVLQTNLPESIPTGATALNIRVTNAGGQDIPGAKVCIRQPDRFQYVTETDAGGEVAFTIPEGIEEGALQVTITKVNCRAVIDTIPVQSGDVNLVVASHEIDDSQGNGDNDRRLDNGETVGLNVTFVNNGVGEARSTGVEARLSANSRFVSFNRDVVAVDDMDSGGGTGTFSSPITITLDPDCPGLTKIAVQISLASQQGSWLGAFELTSSGPWYETASDAIGAQGLRPGAADATLNPSLYNHGDRDGGALNVVLVSRTAGVEVTAANRQYQAIAVGRSNPPSDLFHVRVDRYFAPGVNAEFELRITEGNDANFTHRFTVPVGVPAAGDPVGPDKYGYLAFDSGDTSWEQAPTYEWLEINADAIGGGNIHGTRLDLIDQSNWSSGAEESGASTIIDLPFTFQFYGKDYDKLVVCTNGWVAFDTNAVIFRSPFNRAFPGMDAPDAQIALCWQDLITENNNPFSGVYSYYQTDAGAFILEWSGYYIYDWVMVEDPPNAPKRAPNLVPVQFQLRLLDPDIYPTPTGDGEAVIQYRRYTPAPGYHDNEGFPYAAVGIRNADGTDGLPYLYRGQYSPAAGEIGNEFAIKFTTRLRYEAGTLIGRTVLAEDPNNGVVGIHITHPRGIDVTTGADGRFSLELPVGTYDNVRFELPHHNTIVRSLTIRRGQQVDLGDLAITHPDLVPPGPDNFDLTPVPGYPTDRVINLVNHGNGPLDFNAKIINADSTESNLEMLQTVPLGNQMARNVLGGPVYRTDTDSLYVPASGDPHEIRIGKLSDDGRRYRIMRQPYPPDSTVAGISYLTWDGEHFWGTLTMLDLQLRCVEFNDTGALIRSFDLPYALGSNAVPITYVPERGTLFITHERSPVLEVSVAEGHLGETLHSWDIQVTGEAFNPTGLGWNPRDNAGCPLYIIQSNLDTSARNRYPRRLIRLDPESGSYNVWAPLTGSPGGRGYRPAIKGLTLIPNYSATHMAIAGIDDFIGRGDTLRFYDLGPRTEFLIGGLQLTSGSVPARDTRGIMMHFVAEGMAEGNYSFAVKIMHNAIGDSVIVPVTMTVDSASGIGSEPFIPLDFGIAEAFPNPFNSDLAVRFVAPVGVNARLKVFDLVGREVGTLYDGVSHGSARVVWKAADLPSGIYIVRLEAGGRVDQMKAALIK